MEMITSIRARFNAAILQKAAKAQLSSNSNNQWHVGKLKVEDECKAVDVSDDKVVRQWFVDHPITHKSHFEIDQIVGTGTFGIVRIAEIDLSRPHNTKIHKPVTLHRLRSPSRRRPASYLKVAVKQLSKKSILQYNQLPHIENEKSILYKLQSDFIVSLYTHFQDDKYCYFILEYAIGGELFSILRDRTCLSIDDARFYSAEIFLAISYLHSMNVIYRDLKPENIMIDRLGHIKLVDFGFAKQTLTNSWTLCGTPEYLAPEVVMNKGHHTACDWWAFGVLIYEMIAGFPPFHTTDNDIFKIYKQIIKAMFHFNAKFDGITKEFVGGLLVVAIPQRLGCGIQGDEEIKFHAFYETVDWKAMQNKSATPPIIPKTAESGDDTKYFDDYDSEDVETEIFPNDQHVLTVEEQADFKTW